MEQYLNITNYFAKSSHILIWLHAGAPLQGNDTEYVVIIFYFQFNPLLLCYLHQNSLNKKQYNDCINKILCELYYEFNNKDMTKQELGKYFNNRIKYL